MGSSGWSHITSQVRNFGLQREYESQKYTVDPLHVFRFETIDKLSTKHRWYVLLTPLIRPRGLKLSLT